MRGRFMRGVVVYCWGGGMVSWLANSNEYQKMSLKEVVRAGQSGGRKAAVRQELLPSQQPLPKPTRDISASNRSHSITKEQPPSFPSHRRLLLIERQAEEVEFEKQANVVYTKQFRSLAKLLGNETMQFEQLRVKIQSLLVKEQPFHADPLLLRIQNLQRELVKRNINIDHIGRSTQSLPSSNEYLRGLQNELGRKSKVINELGDSIKRQAFEEAFRQVQVQLQRRNEELKQAEEMNQELRLKANANMALLEEELVKHKQTIQKLTFELDTQKRRAQTYNEDVERVKRREKELLNSLQTETKANYQGMTYSISTLVMQLQARDQSLQLAQNSQQAFEEQIYALKQQISTYQQSIHRNNQDLSTIQNRLHFQLAQKEKVIEEMENTTKQLQKFSAALNEANLRSQYALEEKENIQSELKLLRSKKIEMEVSAEGLKNDRDSNANKISQLKQSLQALNLELRRKMQELQERENEKTESIIQNEQLIKMVSDYKIIEQTLTHKIHLLDQQIHTLQESLKDKETHSKQQTQKIIHSYQQRLNQVVQALNQQKSVSSQLNNTINQLTISNEQYLINIRGLKSNIQKTSQLVSQKQNEKVFFHQKVESYQHEKQVLQQRLQQSQRLLQQLNEKLRRTQQALHQKSTLQLQITSRIAQQQQLRYLLDESAHKQAQLEGELYQRQLHLKDVQQQHRKQTIVLQEEIAKLTKYIQEIQEQYENERHGEQARYEEQYRAREEMENELKELRAALVQLQSKQVESARVQSESETVKIRQIIQEYSTKVQFQKYQNNQLKSDNEGLRDELMQAVRKHQLQIQQFTLEIERQKQTNKQILQYKLKLQGQLQSIQFSLEQIREEKRQLQRQIQTTRRSENNELGSFSFNHYQGEVQTTEKLKAVIQSLQMKLDQHKREEQNRIRLSYSHTVENSPNSHAVMLGSLQEEHEILIAEKQRADLELQSLRQNLTRKGRQIQDLIAHTQQLKGRVAELEAIREGDLIRIASLTNTNTQLTNSNSMITQQRNQLQQSFRQLQREYFVLQQRYNIQKNKIHIQEVQLQPTRDIRLVTSQLQGANLQLIKANEQISKLRQRINLMIIELQNAKREGENEKKYAYQYQKRANDFELKISELQQQIKKSIKQSSILQQKKSNKQDDFDQQHRILSRLSKKSIISKRSSISQKQKQQINSNEPSSDGQLSRRILNDPSKISGQQSKFTHGLLVFESNPRPSLHRMSNHMNPPIYIASPSTLEQNQQRREQSHSQSRSKTKINISYGNPSNKSIQIKGRGEESRSQVSKGSRVSQNSQIQLQNSMRRSPLHEQSLHEVLPKENYIDQVSPIQIKQNIQSQQPSLYSSQKKELISNLQSRQVINANFEQPSQSLINGINQSGSRISTFGNPRTSIVQPVRIEKGIQGVIKRESLPLTIQPRIEIAHSPRHSNIVFNTVKNSNSAAPFKYSEPIRPTQFSPRAVNMISINRIQRKPQQFNGQRSNELQVQQPKIMMRSVIGGKRNSLLNDTATFGKNSQRSPGMQQLSESNDSGIDVLQMDWMAPCCKHE